MADLWTRDTWITALIMASAILIILPVQLILCFKAKKRLVKLLPTALLIVTVIVFYIMMIAAKDWVAFVYAILAVAFGVMLLFSGIAWGIWAIAKFVKKKKM